MSEKLGHFRVLKSEAQILHLERRSDLPVMMTGLGTVLVVVVWFLKPWQFSSGLVVSVVLLALSAAGAMAMLYGRPWKEVVILDRADGDMTRRVKYLVRSDKSSRLPLDTIASVRPEQRTMRILDKRGQMVEHAYWAAVLRTASGEDMEIDAANSPKRMRQLAQAINGFIAGSGRSYPR